MTNVELFREVAARVRDTEDRFACADFGRLYEMVLREAPRILRSFKKHFGSDGIDDLAADFLVKKLDAVVEADNPLALLTTALRRFACSRKRRKDANSVELMEAHTDRIAGADGSKPVQNLELEEAQIALNCLSVRDREIILAFGAGHEPEEVADAFGTSRANVYQVISRFRRRFKRESP